ncbi:MAG: metallophosphoesterase [Chitinophagales bacterium]|nr:metallophosphoesterase [Chitinophagales bacterium]HMU98493.1 metallophosphoesterase [Chitinophagales bacterium]HMY43241.1 metallophosphoesterase [Chitinophagales bacterium]HNB38514.1 metallophosphoesterase [Chitinophagales bacterium]HNE87020.1 metallophosphoesterase [Chitinophagales bacterium]
MRTYIPYIFFAVILIVDSYLYFNLSKNILVQSKHKKKLLLGYLFLCSITYITLIIANIIGYKDWAGSWFKNLMFGFSISFFLARFLILPILLLLDLIRLFFWVADKKSDSVIQQNNGISRLTFFYKSALVLGGSLFGGFIYGVIKGAYNIRTNYIKIKIKSLPDEFKQLKIVQISDLHVGNFLNTHHLENMVQKINDEKPDFVFFTGDLVNFKSDELIPFLPTLKKLNANRRIYSILGNHDYGEYYDWENATAKEKNLQDLVAMQEQELGWRLLRDEHELLDYRGYQMAIIGVEYWGHSMHFGKKGNIQKAYSGAEEADLHLLLSHDPSHWDKEIVTNEKYQSIDVTFSGHTHGFQFGVEIPKLNFQWSPSKFVYPHWAGLYQIKEQQLYVNRGMGYVGYPGRLGIPPEITVFNFTSV